METQPEWRKKEKNILKKKQNFKVICARDHNYNKKREKKKQLKKNIVTHTPHLYAHVRIEPRELQAVGRASARTLIHTMIAVIWMGERARAVQQYTTTAQYA